MSDNLIRAGIAALFVVMAAALGYEWYKTGSLRQEGRRVKVVLLVIVSLELTWLSIVAIWPNAMGSTYKTRFRVLDTNFIVMMGAAVCSLSLRPKQVATGIVAFVIGIVWAFIAGLNAAG